MRANDLPMRPLKKKSAEAGIEPTIYNRKSIAALRTRSKQIGAYKNPIIHT